MVSGLKKFTDPVSLLRFLDPLGHWQGRENPPTVTLVTFRHITQLLTLSKSFVERLLHRFFLFPGGSTTLNVVALSRFISSFISSIPSLF